MMGRDMNREALDAANNACLKLAANHGFATGPGDTVADMIGEFDRRIAEQQFQVREYFRQSARDQARLAKLYADYARLNGEAADLEARAIVAEARLAAIGDPHLFDGLGMAMRREDEPPIPGEPLMSMADAKERLRDALRRPVGGS